MTKRKESRLRPFSRGAAALLLLCAALASTHADAQSSGGRGGGGRKGGQQPTTEQPATPVTPAPAAAPLPWPRLESGALLCSSREDLIKYQTQTSGTAAPANPDEAPDCHTIATQTGIDIVSHDGPSRTQVVTTGTPRQTGWTNTYLPATAPSR